MQLLHIGKGNVAIAAVNMLGFPRFILFAKFFFMGTFSHLSFTPCG